MRIGSKLTTVGLAIALFLLLAHCSGTDVLRVDTSSVVLRVNVTGAGTTIWDTAILPISTIAVDVLDPQQSGAVGGQRFNILPPGRLSRVDLNAPEQTLVGPDLAPGQYRISEIVLAPLDPLVNDSPAALGDPVPCTEKLGVLPDPTMTSPAGRPSSQARYTIAVPPSEAATFSISAGATNEARMTIDSAGFLAFYQGLFVCRDTVNDSCTPQFPGDPRFPVPCIESFSALDDGVLAGLYAPFFTFQ